MGRSAMMRSAPGEGAQCAMGEGVGKRRHGLDGAG